MNSKVSRSIIVLNRNKKISDDCDIHCQKSKIPTKFNNLIVLKHNARDCASVSRSGKLRYWKNDPTKFYKWKLIVLYVKITFFYKIKLHKLFLQKSALHFSLYLYLLVTKTFVSRNTRKHDTGSDALGMTYKSLPKQKIVKSSTNDYFITNNTKKNL